MAGQILNHPFGSGRRWRDKYDTVILLSPFSDIHNQRFKIIPVRINYTAVICYIMPDRKIPIFMIQNRKCERLKCLHLLHDCRISK